MIEIFAIVGMYAMLLLGMTIFMEDTSFEEAHRKVVNVVRIGIRRFVDMMKEADVVQNPLYTYPVIEVEYDNTIQKYKFEETSTTARFEFLEEFFTYYQFRTQDWNNQVFRVMIYARNLKQEKYADNIDVLREIFKAELAYKLRKTGLFLPEINIPELIYVFPIQVSKDRYKIRFFLAYNDDGKASIADIIAKEISNQSIQENTSSDTIKESCD